MNKFFVESENIGKDKIYITEKEDVHHISKVLRLRQGEKLEISDGFGKDYLAEIDGFDGHSISCNVLEEYEESREPKSSITLFQGLPKQGKMELIIQKAVELGASKIVPCILKRSINTDAGKADKKVERWQKIAKEAACQSKRSRIPEVGNSLGFPELLRELPNYDLAILAYEDEKNLTLKDVLKDIGDKGLDVAVIIGPEGGLEAREVESLKEVGAKCVSLGKTILRTETAGFSAIAMIIYELEM